MAMEIVLASNNQGKLKEFAQLFAPLGITILPQGDLSVPEAEEPYLTFIENALGKARNACTHTGKPALADDSGICVSALQDAPGIYSARYAGLGSSDAQNNAHLIQQLHQTQNPDRSARYVCALVFIRYAKDPEPLITVGHCDGQVIDEPLGSNGFGYDPHFYFPQFGKTAAQMSADEKQAISHRAMALHQMLPLLKKQLGITA